MHRFYLPPAHCHGPALELTGREAHHALHVLRVRRGERVTVLDGEGQQLECEVQERARDSLGLKVVERRSVARLPYQLTLLQAIPKGKLLESIIQKAAELGVSRIVPLAAERTVTKVDAGEESQKLAKWRMIAVEAIKQCGCAWLPRVESSVTVSQFVLHPPSTDLPLVGSLRSNSRHPRQYFEDFERSHGTKPKSVSVAIGPEGDFTDEELSLLQSAGALPINLGPLVLRVETAAVYCLSIINYELQSG